MNLDKNKYVVIFCTPLGSDLLTASLKAGSYYAVSSKSLNLPLGIRAVAVRKWALPRGVPFQTGGGAVKYVLKNSVVWADSPERFEAGTPGVVNVIALAKALQLARLPRFDTYNRHSSSISTAEDILYQDKLLGLGGTKLLIELRNRITSSARPFAVG